MTVREVMRKNFRCAVISGASAFRAHRSIPGCVLSLVEPLHPRAVRPRDPGALAGEPGSTFCWRTLAMDFARTVMT